MSGVSGSSQPDYAGPFQDLHTWIDRRSISSYDIKTGAIDQDRKFMPKSLVEIHFQEADFKKTKQLLKEVFPQGNGPSAKDVAETCPRIFCILALIGKTKYIQSFVKTIALFDDRLPFEVKPRNFPTSTSDPDFFDKFYKKQWRFCAPDLSIRSGARFEDEYIVPFSELKHTAGGGHATVYKATVRKEHDKVGKNPGNCYALKTFSTRGSDYNRELDAFRKITASGTRTADNIIDFYGGFEYRATFNLVLEYAEGGSVDEYFERYQPPNHGHGIIDFWEAIFGLCQALQRIHESHLPPDAQGQRLLLQGWHQDLKPANILVVKASTSSRFPWIFKVADLGLSHFRRILEGQSEATGIDRSGTRTYGAPECYAGSVKTVDRRNLITRKIDIWSLGGIYSEAAVWLVNGYTGIEAYREARKKATDQIDGFRDGDCFHDGCRRLAVVDRQHDGISRDMHRDDFLTGHALRVIGPEMLHSSPTSRPTAEMLVSKAENLVKDARRELNKKKLDLSANEVSSQRPSTHQSNSDPTTNSYHYPQGPENPQHGGVYSSPQHTNSSYPHNAFISTFAHPQVGPSDNPHGQWLPPQTQGFAQLQGRLNHIVEEQTQNPHQLNTAPKEPPPLCSLEQALAWRKNLRYNKLVSLPHEEGLMWELDGRDHVFMIDDSKSMKAHWKAVGELAYLLAYITKKKDKDGLELYFLSSERGYKCNTATKVSNYIEGWEPNKMTNLNSRLATDVREYRAQIDQNKDLTRRRRSSFFQKSALKQRSIYVFTDGVWESGNDDQEHDAIIQTANKLTEAGLDRKQIGIQFIRFGDDPVGKQRLEVLDNLKDRYNLSKDIVDTEPANGNVWKMLLGAINDKFDGDPVTSPIVPYGMG